jgi:hypothetical protein
MKFRKGDHFIQKDRTLPITEWGSGVIVDIVEHNGNYYYDVQYDFKSAIKGNIHRENVEQMEKFYELDRQKMREKTIKDILE